MATTDARPVPKKNVAYRLYFDIRKNDGTLITSWTGADTELSRDGGNYADATNEATEIQTSGTGYIDLTAGEMNADCVIVKTTVTNTGALPFVAVLFPTEAADIPVDASASAVASVTAGVSLADDAITSAKFDESTAFPLASADTGATAVARTGADSDTLETLSDQIDALTPSGGDGARTVVVTVTDGTNPLVNAAVRATDANGVTSWALRTDENGQCTFTLGDDTWTLAASLTGYSHESEKLVVDGDKTPTLEMTLVAVPGPSDSNFCSCYLYTYGSDDQLLAGVVITFAMIMPAPGDGMSNTNEPFTATSDVNGRVLVELRRGARFLAWRTSGDPAAFTVPDEDNYAIPQVFRR